MKNHAAAPDRCQTTWVAAFSCMITLTQKLRSLRYGLFYKLLVRREVELLSLGNATGGCRWTFCPNGLSAECIVYTGGVGGDTSFEHELVRRYQCRVVLCDPSPTGSQTMKLPHNRIDQFRFFPLALAGQSGKLHLSPPINQEGDWWASSGPSPAGMEVPCVDLLSLMKQNGHNHIDLLKLDIEASEYAVISNLLERRIPVRQLCVEFHHGVLPGVRRSQTISSIFKLLVRGYRLIHQDANNHTFLSGGKTAHPEPMDGREF